MLFESLALAGVGRVLAKGVGADALKGIARTVERTGLASAEDAFKAFRFVREDVAPFANIAYRAGVGGAAGYAVGTGIDWYTGDTRWANRLGMAGLAAGAGVGVARSARPIKQIALNALHKTSVAKGKAAEAATISDVFMKEGRLHGIRRTMAGGPIGTYGPRSRWRSSEFLWQTWRSKII